MRIESAFHGLFENLPGRVIPWALRFVTFPLGRRYLPPRDRVAHDVCQLVLSPGPARDRLTAGMFLPPGESHPLGILEAALAAVIAAEPLERTLRAAHDAGSLSSAELHELGVAVERGIITEPEARTVERARSLRRRAIMVDDFPKDLGRTEIYQTSEPVTFDALSRAGR